MYRDAEHAVDLTFFMYTQSFVYGVISGILKASRRIYLFIYFLCPYVCVCVCV